MSKSIIFLIARLALLHTLFAVLLPTSPAQKSTQTHSRRAAPPLSAGRQLFANRCAPCHGLDGRGGDRAPDIATRTAVQQRSDADLAHIVRNGIPAAGMPAFSTLDDATLKSLITYLRALQGKSGEAKLPGDPRAGEAIFFSKARCSECHTITGKGGFIASDLSVFAQGRAVNEIRNAIVSPSNLNPQATTALVTTRTGEKFSGIVRNEDNFSLQLQTLDGAFHLFLKSDLEGLTREPGTLMPSDYGATLSPQELNDLIAYLMHVANSDKSPVKKRAFREDEENE